MPERHAESRLITTKRAAELLGVTPNWLYLMRKRGTGPAWTRIGARHIRYYEDSVLALRKSRYRDGGRARLSPSAKRRIRNHLRRKGDS